jgi:hypothetical protein
VWGSLWNLLGATLGATLAFLLVRLTDKRSAKAAQTLRLAGYADISVLRSGMQQWSANGLPVETHAVSPAA